MPTNIKTISIKIVTDSKEYKTLLENKIDITIPEHFNSCEINRHLHEVANMAIEQHITGLTHNDYFEVQDEQ